MSLDLQPTLQPGVWRLPGLSDYETVWQAMRDFTEGRNEQTPDQVWLVEHHPVYTLGLAGKPEHVLAAGHIPIIKSDRGGQVTYHGPGQVVAYVLVDLRRIGMTIRDMVHQLESAMIETLHTLGIPHATRRQGAPGVYVPVDGEDLAKIAALGLKVRKGCTYHGVSLNVDMDLSPFDGINPCGYPGLRTTSLQSCGLIHPWDTVALQLARDIVHACRVQVE